MSTHSETKTTSWHWEMMFLTVPDRPSCNSWSWRVLHPRPKQLTVGKGISNEELQKNMSSAGSYASFGGYPKTCSVDTTRKSNKQVTRDSLGKGANIWIGETCGPKVCHEAWFAESPRDVGARAIPSFTHLCITARQTGFSHTNWDILKNGKCEMSLVLHSKLALSLNSTQLLL